MKKHYIFSAMLCMAGCLQMSAQRVISSFREVNITNGQTATIGGEQRSEPDIYYVPQSDGTYEAVRLTVAPGPETPAAVTRPYLYMSTPTSVRVCWKTSSKAGASVVKFGTSPEKLDRTASLSYNQISSSYFWNTAKLEGLSPNTAYYYQVESNGVTSDVYRFRTMPEAADNKKIRVLFIGDHQRNEHSDYEWMLNAAHQTIKEKCGDTPFEDNVQFLMNVGDQVDGGYIDLYESVHLYKSRSVSPTLPIMTVVGNHEYRDDPELKLYNGHYAYGEMEYKGIKSGTANYYAYQVGCVLFMAINSDEPTAAQKMWIRKVIAAASADKTVDFIVSAQHRPLYAEQYCNDVSPWMLNEIMPILSSTRKHVLNCGGHHHLYARGQMTDSPVYHIISGGGVGTTVSGYEQLWGRTPDNFDHPEVQKTIDQWTYQIFEFDPASKEMTVETYSIGNSRLALDNELVDKFTRKLDDAVAPAKPELADIAAPVHLPYTFAQKSAVEGLHSVQYQIARDNDFTDIVIDDVVTAENMYGVDEKYMPLDINKGVDITRHMIENGRLANGVYYIRVRNRNANLNWSEYSDSYEFAVDGAAEVPQILTDGKFYRTGGTVTVEYWGAPVGTSAWLGLYQYDKKPGTSDLSDQYVYTSGADGQWSFPVNEPGAYFITLFKDGGYTEITDRIDIVVSDNCDDGNPPFINTDKRIYEVGEPIVVRHFNAPCISKDWVGLYDYNCELAVNGKSHSYDYVGTEPDGSVTLNVSGNHNFTTPVGDGLYYVCYYNTDGYHEATDRQFIVVGKPVMVETDKQMYLPYETINIVYEGAPTWMIHRLVAFKDGVIAVDEHRSDNLLGGTTVWDGISKEGEYEICMLDDENNELSPRVKINVSSKASVDAVNAPTCKMSVNGNTVRLLSASAISTVKVFAADGTLVETHKAGGANATSFTLGAAKGVYLVNVDGHAAGKVVVK